MLRACLLSLATVSLAACPAPGGDDIAEPDATGDAAVDAGADAALTSCPVIDLPARPIGVIPAPGEWRGAWTCTSGCNLPAPPIVVATSVIIVTAGNDEAVWRRPTSPMTIMKPPIVAAGTCWRMEPFDAVRENPQPGERGCRGPVEICGTTCDGAACVVAVAMWTDLASGDAQSWTFTGGM